MRLLGIRARICAAMKCEQCQEIINEKETFSLTNDLCSIDHDLISQANEQESSERPCISGLAQGDEVNNLSGDQNASTHDNKDATLTFGSTA